MSSIFARIPRCGFSVRLFASGLLAASLLTATTAVQAAYYNVTGKITGIDTVGATSDPSLTMTPGNPPFGDLSNVNPLATGNHASVWQIDTSKKTISGVLNYPNWSTAVSVMGMSATITQPNAIYRFGGGTVAFTPAVGTPAGGVLTLGQAMTFGGSKDQASDAKLLWNSSPAVPTAVTGTCSGNSTVCDGQNQYFLANPDQERFYMKLTFSADGKSFTGEGVGIDVGGTLSIGVTGNTFQSYTFKGDLIHLDQDKDGVDEDNGDKCPNTPAAEISKIFKPGTSNATKYPQFVGCGPSERDLDADTVFDNADNCVTVANTDQKNFDGDSLGDACDNDDDNDDVFGDEDQCPFSPLGSEVDPNTGCPPAGGPVDTDKDGVTDDKDLCANTPAGTVVDATGCAVVVVADADKDTIPDATDNCPNAANTDQKDADGDRVGDVCDTTPRGTDADGDGVPALDDKCPNTETSPTGLDASGCSDAQRAANTDTDGDGIFDSADNCKDVKNANQKNKDGDLLGDACDDDIDGDTVANAADNCPLVPNADQKDTDGNHVGDVCQSSVALDTAFDTDGKAGVSVGADGYEYANAVVQLADGSSVVAGVNNLGDAANVNEAIALAKFKADGTPDTSFGTGGVVVLDVTPAANDAALAIIEQGDHKLVVVGFSGGSATTPGGAKSLFARFNANGSADTGFGVAGIKEIDTGAAGYEKLQSVVQQADGKLVAAGYTCKDAGCAQSQATLVRLDASNALDTMFGVNGVTTPVYSADSANNISLALADDGKLVAVGAVCADATCSHTNSVVARFAADGQMDATFAGTGFQVLNGIGLGSQLNAVKVRKDGKIIATGASLVTANNSDVVLAAFNADGGLDSTFGTAGITRTDITTSGADADTGTSLSVQSDGKVLVGGVSGVVDAEDMFIARYAANGAFDTVTPVDFNGENDGGYALSEAVNGKVVLAGSAQTASKVDGFALARFNAPADVAPSTDDDNDGVLNDVDMCPDTLVGAEVNAAGCSDAQRDTDSDGVKDNIDQCAGTPAGTVVDSVGCSIVVPPADDDGDGVNNASDICPNTLAGAVVDAVGCSAAQRDTDSDGVKDNMDQCPNTPAGSTVDNVGCPLVIADSDGDGIPNDKDLCPATRVSERDKVDGNGCAPSQRDTDGDGKKDNVDNCPLVANPDQNNSDQGNTPSDRLGDVCDPDDDNDGVPDYIDSDPVDQFVTDEIVLPLDGAFKGVTVRDRQGVM